GVQIPPGLPEIGTGGAATPQRNQAMAWMEQVREFVKDVRVESTKISWPTRNELRDSTIVVIVPVIIVMVFVGAVDRSLAWAGGLLFRCRPRPGRKPTRA